MDDVLSIASNLTMRKIWQDWAEKTFESFASVLAKGSKMYVRKRRLMCSRLYILGSGQAFWNSRSYKLSKYDFYMNPI